MRNKKVSTIILGVAFILIVIILGVNLKIEKERYGIAVGTVTEVNDYQIIFERNNDSNSLHSASIKPDTPIFDENGNRIDLRKIRTKVQKEQFIVVKYKLPQNMPAIYPKPLQNVIEIVLK